jgi:hypothetical protein
MLLHASFLPPFGFLKSIAFDSIVRINKWGSKKRYVFSVFYSGDQIERYEALATKAWAIRTEKFSSSWFIIDPSTSWSVCLHNEASKESSALKRLLRKDSLHFVPSNESELDLVRIKGSNQLDNIIHISRLEVDVFTDSAVLLDQLQPDVFEQVSESKDVLQSEMPDWVDQREKRVGPTTKTWMADQMGVSTKELNRRIKKGIIWARQMSARRWLFSFKEPKDHDFYEQAFQDQRLGSKDSSSA